MGKFLLMGNISVKSEIAITRISKPAVVLLLALLTAWAVFALVGEHILLQYKKGDLIFSLSFIVLLSFSWSFFRFYKRRKPSAFKPMLLPAAVFLLTLGFNFLYERPCPSVCDVEVKLLVLPSEKQEFTDTETGAKIVRLTSDPAKDNFDYYEPSHWSPDDKKLKFVTTRFREKYEDPVLHMPAVVDIETGEITIYKTRYSLHWSQWSRNGRYIYGTALFKDQKLEPYFIAIDTQKNSAKVLRLKYRVSELPEGFDEKVYAVEDPGKITEGGWLIKGEWRIPYEALYFHLNPSGTLGGFEMYDAFGVVDIKNMKTWVVGIGTNRGAFFDDRTAMVSPLPVNAPYALADTSTPYLVDVFTGETKPHPPGPSYCNHGNVFYEEGTLAKIICPGRTPDTEKGKSAFYLYDIETGAIDILAFGSGGAFSTISSDGGKVAGLGTEGITIYDVETKKVKAPSSGRFLDKYLQLSSGGTAYGGLPMISHDGQKVAFISSVYESAQQAVEQSKLEVKCADLKEVEEWVEDPKRTEEEKQKGQEKLSRPETIDLEKKCEKQEKYAPADIFVIFL